MSAPAHAHADAHGAAHAHHEPNFFFKYVWSTDHKMIGKQFLLTSLFWLFIGGGLALIVRWQLGFPGENVPIVGGLLGAWYGTGGIVNGNSYNMEFTMDASVMIFFVSITVLVGAQGNYGTPVIRWALDMACRCRNAHRRR